MLDLSDRIRLDCASGFGMSRKVIRNLGLAAEELDVLEVKSREKFGDAGVGSRSTRTAYIL